MSIVSEFCANGYVVIPDVLTLDECELYKGILQEAYDSYSGLYAVNSA